ncbi:hypothetical protein ACFL59_05045 [Planctomycetota bacterium]
MESKLNNLAARYGAPLLLVIGALCHIYVADVRELLTPSRGGGFGGLSTVDQLEGRHLRASVSGPGFQSPAVIPPEHSLARTIDWARLVPRWHYLRSIAAGIAHGQKVPIREVQLTVWKQQFDAETLEVRRVKVRELKVTTP